MAAAEVGEPDMTRLGDLRRRLARLKRRRQRIRWGTAWTAAALGVLWILASLFLVDWLLELTRLQRVVMIAAGAGALVWAVRRWSLPWLGHRETELDMAILVERQHRIDTDLVAAVEFEWPEARTWGSEELEDAVVRHVAEQSRGLDVEAGLSRRELGDRAALLLVTLLVWTAVAVIFPSHVATFFERLALGARHYPTRTRIVEIVVNDRRIEDPVQPARTPVLCAWGAPVRFEVTCAGELPTSDGEARLVARQSGLRTSVALAAVEGEPGRYRGELPRLIESVEYQLYLGDAWTDPGPILITPLPRVALDVLVVPPDYAGRSEGPIRMPSGLRQISVIEGSQVILELASDTRLQRAWAALGDDEYAFRREEGSAAADAGVERWTLDAPETPLANVLQPLRYAVQVADAAGQGLEQPIEGYVRIQADAPPRIAAAIVTRYVLPTAAPTIYYRAIDDYGLARVSMLCEITRAPGDAVEEEEIEIYALPHGEKPRQSVEGGHEFDLSPLKLSRGDTVRVTLRATDFRGRNPGRTAGAEPLVFQVTDEQGILAGMLEADRHSARQLRAMIERQLGIGGDLP
jgi:hypothetical protein